MIDWQYIAGFFDGEGSVVRYGKGRNWILTFTNSHEPTLKAIRDFLDYGHIYLTQRRTSRQRDSKKPVYFLKVNRWVDVIRIGQELLPRTQIKSDKLLQMLTEMRSFKRRGKLPPPNEVWRIRWVEGESTATIASRYSVARRSVNYALAKNDQESKIVAT